MCSIEEPPLRPSFLIHPVGQFKPIVTSEGDVAPDQAYDICLVDPPWSYYGSKTKDAAAGKHYDLMSQEDLADLQVKEIMSAKSALFMWATCPRLDFAIDLIRAWGFHYRGVGWVWVKTRKDGTPIHGQGVPPTFTKPTTELLLAASTKPRGRPFQIQTSAMGQVVEVPAPEGAAEYAPRTSEHSEKPKKFHRLIEELAGSGPSKIELFCRGRPEPGWHGWGNECKPAKPMSFRELVHGKKPE